MSFNFFEPSCQEPTINELEFGLCDEPDLRAFTDTEHPSKWIATIKNPKQIKLIFTAIDKCVIKENEAKGSGRCDGMLTSDKHLYFIELKDKDKNWREHAFGQLESTIQFFLKIMNPINSGTKKPMLVIKVISISKPLTMKIIYDSLGIMGLD